MENDLIKTREDIISDDLWQTLMQNGFQSVIIIDRDENLRYLYFAEKFVKAGVDIKNCANLDELARAISGKLVVSDERGTFDREINYKTMADEILDHNEFARTVHFKAREGRRAFSIRVRNIPGSDGKLLFVIFDISAALDHDWMTDEYARSGFIIKAGELLKKLSLEEHYSLVYTNVHGFKAINEIFGEQSGDMAIFQMRDAIKETLRPVILARLESDHFAFICPDAVLSDENLNILCHREFVKDSKKYWFDMCLGIYPIIDRTVPVRIMIDRARLAEKTVKESSVRPWATFSNEIQITYMRERTFIADLSDSIKNGEFKVFYQPVVDARSREVVSAEALIRWQHHDIGMVSPGMFVPLFERSGQISSLDRFMIWHVMDFCMKRAEEGLPMVPCAMNLSRIDFYDTTLLSDIMSAVENAGKYRSLFRFEVTESAYAVMEKEAVAFLNKLRSMDVKIFLDDYGSGMSSLSTLESFDFDVVKLDMGFIRKIGISGKAESIIRSTIELAHSIGAKVVAEGVEDERQYLFLKGSGCDMIQGYYFYKPLTEDDFMGIL